MTDVILDWETYYDTKEGYSLTKMSTEEYIRDDRFNPMGLVVNLPDTNIFLKPRQIEDFLKSIDWSKHRIICHHTRFDGAILSWRYGVRPAMWMDTMGMAAQLIKPYTNRVSLNKVSEHLLGRSKTFGLVQANGVKTFDELPDKQDYMNYALTDGVLTRGIFNIMISAYDSEYGRGLLSIMDIVLRMYFDGALQLDAKTLEVAYAKILLHKKALMQRAKIGDAGDLRSNDKFADLLRGLQVVPPMKVSPATGKLTYAFAKTDPDFRALADHPNYKVQCLHAARIGHKSSLAETRTKRLLDIANTGRPLMVPLKYYGAHTGRLSGDEGLNLQNLVRHTPKQRSAMRDAIQAPKGKRLIVVDASQIEARILAYLSGEKSLVKQFAKGKDVYAAFASTVYGHPVNQDDHPLERFVGKTSILGLGYQCGAPKFWEMLRLNKALRDMPLTTATAIHGTYREKYTGIRRFWVTMADAVRAMGGGDTQKFQWFTTHKDRLVLNNGHELLYPNLYYETNSDRKYSRQWVYGSSPQKTLYGGKLTENIVQALAWDFVMAVAIKVSIAHPEWFLCLQVHDELVYIVDTKDAKRAFKFITNAMRQPPIEFKGVPLDVSGGIGKIYGKISK